MIGTGNWPGSFAADRHAVILNVEHLADFRDNAVHFYNAAGFDLVVHSLAQQSVVNFKDYLRGAFAKELADEISWTFMPLGVALPVDPVTFLESDASPAPNADVRSFLDRLEGTVQALTDSQFDPTRL